MKKMIIFKSGSGPSGWEQLYGHCCYTEAAMNKYVNTFDGTGKYMRVVDYHSEHYIPVEVLGETA